jgi:SAM-dependent methyltransferase
VRRSIPDPRRRLPTPAVLARPALRLALTSATLLFVELALIRWIPANVKYVGFFSNFVLMASFLGIGLGILLGRRFRDPLVSPFPILLLGLTFLVLGAKLNIQVSGGNEIFFGLSDSTSADVNYVVLPAVIALVVALMASLALPLGPLLRSMPPIRAFAVDIAGSLTGIAAFVLLSLAGTGPVTWFGIVGLALALLALGSRVTAWSALGAAAMVLVVLAVARVGAASQESWSPYYRITATDESLAVTSTAQGAGGQPKYLAVDGIPHQAMLSSDEAASSPLHEQVYRWFPDRTFRNVLIIGAGSGTDTALALARGAGHVDAVEIDPELARIGREFHREHVYADPRVTVTVNDGRAFLRSTTAHYDLIVFALTDSLTLVTSTGSVRLESFLFTDEAIASARDRLSPDGVFVMYNTYRQPWLVSKLAAMATTAFGPAAPPIVKLVGPSAAVIGAGPGVQAVASSLPAGEIDRLPAVGDPVPLEATDDWPFLYLRVPDIAGHYLTALAFLLAFAVAAVALATRTVGLSVRRISPHFLVLGSAFLLLETKSLVSFSLLFGTTWLVNAMAFFAILASVLLAIGVNSRLRPDNPAPLYGLLLGAIALAFLVPPEALLIDPPELRYALAAVISFLPVFLANLVFTWSFRETDAADLAFASNLVGAMLGGALEYVALVTGFRFLLVIVATLYVAAFALTRLRLLGDAGLQRAIVTAPEIVAAEL